MTIVPIQTASPAGNIASGTAASLASNATVGNTVLVFIEPWNIETNTVSGTPACTFGPPSKVAAHISGPNIECWIVPVTSVAKTFTPTMASAGYYGIWMQELPGSFTAASVTAGTTSTNPTVTCTVAPGQIAYAVVYSWTALLTNITAVGWTDNNAGAFAWNSGGDVAYISPPSGTSQTATWAAPSSTWTGLGVVLTPAGAVSGAGNAILPYYYK